MIPEENTLAEIVRKFPAAAALFEKYDLDYCCHGKATLREACKDETIFKKVDHALHRIIENEWTNTETVHFDSLPAGELIDHIVSKHHAFVKNSSPLIYAHLEKASLKHSARHPELQKIFQLFARVKTEMEQHMFKEENILFPRIKDVQDALLQTASPWTAGKNYVLAPIQVMQEEHDLAGSILHEIKLESDYFKVPEDACATYRLCYDELKQFEHDLHQHVHLENNILFPKAIAMQQRLIEGILN